MHKASLQPPGTQPVSSLASGSLRRPSKPRSKLSALGTGPRAQQGIVDRTTHPNQVKEEWEPRLDRYCLIPRRKVGLNMEKINEVKRQKEPERG